MPAAPGRRPFRAITAKIGLGANSSDEAIYWLAMRDKNGERLTGGQTYEVRFAQPPLPSNRRVLEPLRLQFQRALCSQSLEEVQPGGPFAASQKHRRLLYHLCLPQTAKGYDNWLPSPEDREPIVLTIRMYAPLPEVLKDPAHSPMPQIIQVR